MDGPIHRLAVILTARCPGDILETCWKYWDDRSSPMDVSMSPVHGQLDRVFTESLPCSRCYMSRQSSHDMGPHRQKSFHRQLEPNQMDLQLPCIYSKHLDRYQSPLSKSTNATPEEPIRKVPLAQTRWGPKIGREQAVKHFITPESSSLHRVTIQTSFKCSSSQSVNYRQSMRRHPK